MRLKKFGIYYLAVLCFLLPPIFLETEVQFIIWALSAVFLFLILLLGEKYYQQKKLSQLQTALLNTELELLKSQINPHFFFNTLNNLYGLTHQNAKKAGDMILELSEMMRYTIYKGQQQNVTLQEELNYIQSYIALQKLRLLPQTSVNFTRDIKNPDTEIAPMLLIGLVENAFKHGAEKMGDQAMVNIECREQDHELIFSVSNHFDTGNPENTNNDKGIGLENLRRRLKLLYPDRHQLSLKKEQGVFYANLTVRK